MPKITERAAIARCNRKLAHANEKLCKSRSWCLDLRNYHVVDLVRNCVLAAYNSLDDAARDIGVLHDGETVEEDER